MKVWILLEETNVDVNTHGEANQSVVGVYATHKAARDARREEAINRINDDAGEPGRVSGFAACAFCGETIEQTNALTWVGVTSGAVCKARDNGEHDAPENYDPSEWSYSFNIEEAPLEGMDDDREVLRDALTALAQHDEAQAQKILKSSALKPGSLLADMADALNDQAAKARELRDAL
jgi:hypothetical protein